MKKNRFRNFDSEVRDLVLLFERTILKGQQQFFDLDELEIIIDYYLEVGDLKPLDEAVRYADYLYPNSPQVAMRHAHQHIAHGRYQQAIDILQKLYDQQPDNTDISYSLGVAYGAMGEPEKAIELYQEATSDGWMLGRVYSNIAEEYHRLGDLEQAISYYETALFDDPNDDVTLYNYTDTCLAANQCEKAINTLYDITQKDPYNYYAWYCLGLACSNNGNPCFSDGYRKAADALQFSIDIDKTFAPAYIELAKIQEHLESPGAAVTTLLRSIEYADQEDYIYCLIGHIYMRANNPETAVIYYTKALDINPTYSYALVFKAYNLLKLGNNREAAADARKAFNIETSLAEERGNPDLADPEILGKAAEILDQLGDFNTASEYYERAITCFGCPESVYHKYTRFLYKHEVYDLVIEFAEESLEMLPLDPFYSTYLAAACFRTNRYNRVRKLLLDVEPNAIRYICLELSQHPLLGQYVPQPSPLPTVDPETW